MQKKFLYMLVTMTMLLLGPAGILADAGMDAIYVPVGTLTLAPPRGVIPQRTPVVFPHSGHFVYTCRTCHHSWDGFAPVKSCTASGCHDQVSAPKRSAAQTGTTAPGLPHYKAAYHQQCIGCHKKLQQERSKQESAKTTLNRPLPETGPTGCVGCHPRN